VAAAAELLGRDTGPGARWSAADGGAGRPWLPHRQRGCPGRDRRAGLWASTAGRYQAPRRPAITTPPFGGGVRPTFYEGGTDPWWRPTCSTPKEDLYAEEAGFSFVARLRDERRFDSVEDLVAQMHREVADTRSVLAGRAPERHLPGRCRLQAHLLSWPLVGRLRPWLMPDGIDRDPTRGCRPRACQAPEPSEVADSMPDKQATIAEHRSTETDTAPPEVQIALTDRPHLDLTEHLKMHKGDHQPAGADEAHRPAPAAARLRQEQRRRALPHDHRTARHPPLAVHRSYLPPGPMAGGSQNQPRKHRHRQPSVASRRITSGLPSTWCGGW